MFRLAEKRRSFFISNDCYDHVLKEFCNGIKGPNGDSVPKGSLSDSCKNEIGASDVEGLVEGFDESDLSKPFSQGVNSVSKKKIKSNENVFNENSLNDVNTTNMSMLSKRFSLVDEIGEIDDESFKEMMSEIED